MDLHSTGDRPVPLGSDQLWLSRKDWTSGDLYYCVVRDPSTFIVSGFGVILLLVAVGFAVSLPALFRQGGYAACIPLLVTGSLGIALTTRGIRLVIRWIKYGGWRFHLASVPVPLGGPRLIKNKMSTPIAAGQPVRLRLECCMVRRMQPVSTNGSKDTSTTSSTVWEDEETVTSDGTGTVQVSFVIPADCHATKLQPRSWETSNEWVASCWWIEWRLIVRDPSGGRQGYFAEFELPVFQVAQTAQQAREAESIRVSRKTELEAYRPGPDFKVRVSPGADGSVEFFFPPVRGGANAIGQTIAFLLTAALFAAVWE